MIKSIHRIILLVLCSVISQNAIANNNEGIEVVGNGVVTVAPDQFSLSLTISQRGRLPSKLHSLIDHKSNLVIAAAKKLKVKDKDIQSAQVNLRIIKEKPSITVHGLEMEQGKQGNAFVDGNIINEKSFANQKQLFELSRYITVHFSTISDYDKFLEQIVKLNVSHISTLSMSVKQRDKYYQQALMKAIDHAKLKAHKMIKQTGGKLGELIYLKEVSGGHYQPRYAQSMMSESISGSHSSLVGTQEITASVLVKFSIKP